jgi:hypothetical protein
LVVTGGSLYLLFKWNDPTGSVTYKAWKFDGEKWSHLKGNEDRVALLFEENPDQQIRATKGCVMTCHGPSYTRKPI